jgi:hypothetical protein
MVNLPSIETAVAKNDNFFSPTNMRFGFAYTLFRFAYTLLKVLLE